MDIKEFLGRLDAKSEATKEHLISVSAKADGIRDDFDEHLDDLNAHGADAVKAARASTDSTWQKWAAVIALAVSFLTLLWEAK